MVADFLLLISANIFAVALIVVYLVSALTRWNRVLRISGSAVVALAVASHQLLVSYGSYQGDNIPVPFFYLTVFLTNLIFFLIPLALGVVCVSLTLTSFRVIKRYNYFGLNVYNWPVIGAILRRYERLKVQEFLATERQRLLRDRKIHPWRYAKNGKAQAASLPTAFNANAPEESSVSAGSQSNAASAASAASPAATTAAAIAATGEAVMAAARRHATPQTPPLVTYSTKVNPLSTLTPEELQRLRGLQETMRQREQVPVHASVKAVNLVPNTNVAYSSSVSQGSGANASTSYTIDTPDNSYDEYNINWDNFIEQDANGKTSRKSTLKRLAVYAAQGSQERRDALSAPTLQPLAPAQVDADTRFIAPDGTPYPRELPKRAERDGSYTTAATADEYLDSSYRDYLTNKLPLPKLSDMLRRPNNKDSSFEAALAQVPEASLPVKNQAPEKQAGTAIDGSAMTFTEGVRANIPRPEQYISLRSQQQWAQEQAAAQTRAAQNPESATTVRGVWENTVHPSVQAQVARDQAAAAAAAVATVATTGSAPMAGATMAATAADPAAVTAPAMQTAPSATEPATPAVDTAAMAATAKATSSDAVPETSRPHANQSASLAAASASSDLMLGSTDAALEESNYLAVHSLAEIKTQQSSPATQEAAPCVQSSAAENHYPLHRFWQQATQQPAAVVTAATAAMAHVAPATLTAMNANIAAVEAANKQGLQTPDASDCSHQQTLIANIAADGASMALSTRAKVHLGFDFKVLPRAVRQLVMQTEQDIFTAQQSGDSSLIDPKYAWVRHNVSHGHKTHPQAHDVYSDLAALSEDEQQKAAAIASFASDLRDETQVNADHTRSINADATVFASGEVRVDAHGNVKVISHSSLSPASGHGAAAQGTGNGTATYDGSKVHVYSAKQLQQMTSPLYTKFRANLKQYLGNILALTVRRAGYLFLALSLVMACISTAKIMMLPQINYVTVELNVPQAFDGMRIMQISNLNASAMYNRQHMSDLVMKITKQRPDLIVFTGDLALGEPWTREEGLRPLFMLKAPLGVYAIPGDHDYSIHFEQYLSMYRRYNFDMLLNESRTIRYMGAKLSIIGIADESAPQYGVFLPSYRQIEVDPDSTFNIVLTHTPRNARQYQTTGYHSSDLILSGTVLSNQVQFLDEITTHINNGFLDGLYRLSPIAMLYVSTGTGTNPFLPLRYGNDTELTLLTVHSTRIDHPQSIHAMEPRQRHHLLQELFAQHLEEQKLLQQQTNSGANANLSGDDKYLFEAFSN